MSDIRKAAEDTPSDEWLDLLADAMEEDIAGVERLEVTGYMCDRLRRIGDELKMLTTRIDDLQDMVIDAVGFISDDEEDPLAALDEEE